MKELEAFPWLFPPRDADPFDENQALTLGANSGLTLLVTIQRTVGYEGILRYLELSSTDFGNTSSPHSFFQIQVGKRPIAQYSKITQPMLATTPTLIFISPNQPLDLYANNLTAAPVALRFRLNGWYYKPLGAK